MMMMMTTMNESRFVARPIVTTVVMVMGITRSRFATRLMTIVVTMGMRMMRGSRFMARLVAAIVATVVNTGSTRSFRSAWVFGVRVPDIHVIFSMIIRLRLIMTLAATSLMQLSIFIIMVMRMTGGSRFAITLEVIIAVTVSKIRSARRFHTARKFRVCVQVLFSMTI